MNEVPADEKDEAAIDPIFFTLKPAVYHNISKHYRVPREFYEIAKGKEQEALIVLQVSRLHAVTGQSVDEQIRPPSGERLRQDYFTALASLMTE